MEDLSRWCCLNERCVAYGTRGAGNLSVCGHMNKAKTIRQLYCCVCKKRFSERKGTVLYWSRLPEEKVVAILRHVQDGNGMRQTGRLVGTKEDTVIRYVRKAGEHARQLHQDLVAFSPRTRELQLDEKWAFVFKKRGHCSPQELEQERCGDCWDHVAFDPEHRLVLGVVFGRREQCHIQKLVKAVKAQLGGRVPSLITTDGYAAYAEVFRRVFSTVSKPVHRRGEPNPGGPKRQVLAELTFATVQKVMEKGRVVEVKRELVLGSRQNLHAALEDSSVSSTINTAFVERHNATDRHRNARKSRKTYRFSKDWDVHAAGGYFVLYSYNFCWCVRTLRVRRKNGTHQPRTPAMAAGLTDHVWSVGQWLSYPAVNRSG